MRRLPLGVRVLLCSLGLAAVLPFLLVLAEFAGAIPPGLGWLVAAISFVIALFALLAFEPPRSASPLAWLRQLQRRIDSLTSLSSPPSPPEA
jgi:hypothetical protein